MADPWLHIVGIGEDGLDGLVPATRAVVEAADVILGGARHHELAENINAERLAWPSPFDAMVETIKGLKGRRAVVLVTGDPLWFSVGARIGRAIDPAEIVYHPQLSAFQLAAARMGWSLADVETLTVHGRPVEQMIAFIQPDVRLLILTTGAETPAQIAAFLTERGFGQSKMSVLAAMGGKDELRFDGLAEGWDHEVPAFNTLAVECVAAPDAALLPRVPGLTDALFQSDGTMTKQEVRAATLAKLMPMRGALLWDIGCNDINSVSDSSVTAFATKRPKGRNASQAATKFSRLMPPPMKIASGASNPAKASGAVPATNSNFGAPTAIAFAPAIARRSSRGSMPIARA